MHAHAHAHAHPADSAGQRHRPKTLTVFVAAFAAGAVLAYGVDRVVDVHAMRAEPQVESEPIFVALRSLPQGAPVTVWDVALKDWPKAMLPTTALKADASLEGMVLRHPIREGQPLLSVQLVRDASPPPTGSLAALPPVADPVALEPWQAPSTSASVPTPAPALDTAPVAITAAPAGEASPFAAAVAASDTDIDVQGKASGTGGTCVERTPDVVDTDVGRIESPSVVALPAAVPGWAAAAALTPAATSTPAPAVAPLPAATTGGITDALAAPVPSLPSTDLAGPLAGFALAREETAARAPSVLDRTTADEPPAPDRRMPKHHLVVPERVALAVDASFAQVQPSPSAEETAPAVTPPTGIRSPDGTAAEIGSAAPGGDSSRSGGRKPAFTNPSARKPATPGRQSSGRPQSPPQFRGLGAWFPHFSSGTRQQ